ncbi:MAG: VOC family protein [Hamadaea sp.]|nr:VOC family protein [Hamadaea sp.]
MTESKRMSPQEFLDKVGLEDWRLLGDGATAYYPTPSFAQSARLVTALGDLPGGPSLDVDVRASGVTVRLPNVTEAGYVITDADADLAQAISATARDLGLAGRPEGLQNIQICIDALVTADVLPFWRVVLGYVDRTDGDSDLLDPGRRGPLTYFQEMDEPRPQRNRVHFDVWVAHDQAEARVAAAIAAGGRLVTDEHAPTWWVLADAEGNEACVCTWQRPD